MKKRKWWKIAIGVFGGILVVGLCGTGIMFREEMKIAGSIKHVVEGKNIYYMEVESDYHFEEFLEAGGASSDGEVSDFLTECISKGFYKTSVENKGAGCSTISAKTSQNSHVWGRNFDWYGSVPVIVKTVPKEGYASVATCDFQNITGSSEILPESFLYKMLAIASVYVPMDGINEAGLCVADLEVNEGGMKEVDTGKPDLTITTAIRLLLNRAATVEEAVELLEGYDIHASGGISHHLSISDGTGASVCVEFVEGEMVVVDADYITNFNLANGDTQAGGESAWKRYECLSDIYREKGGVLSREEVRDALSKVSQSEGEWTTQWSVVYDQENRRAEYYFGGEFGEEVSFEVK